MNRYHILNGDCLLEKFPNAIEGEKIVWRECLISGPVSESQFFENRKQFINENFADGNSEYESKVQLEFDKMLAIPENSEVYFWFEDDAFCQVNFWFLLSRINASNLNLFVVFPPVEEGWKGFGPCEESDLNSCFLHSEPISLKDVELGKNLWTSFANYDFQTLKSLGKKPTNIFRKLHEVTTAIENLHNGNVENQIQELKIDGSDFPVLFRKFSQNHGVYGLGDLQFQLILNQMENG